MNLRSGAGTPESDMEVATGLEGMGYFVHVHVLKMDWMKDDDGLDLA